MPTNTVPAASSPRGAGKRVGCYHATQRDAAGTVMGQLALFFIPNFATMPIKGADMTLRLMNRLAFAVIDEFS